MSVFELIINCLTSSFLYILSIAFQLTGAVVGLLAITKVSRASIIKSFNAKTTVMIDGETREVSELGPAIRERFELSYTHCAAFIFLAVGYILSIFGEKNADNWSIAFWVLLFTAALWGLAKVVILCLLRQERVTMKATEEELKKYNVEPDLSSYSIKEIEDMANRVFYNRK